MIVFDELHLGVAESVRARAAVMEFLKRGVADGDRIALVGTHEGTRVTARMPEGRAALEQALARLQPRLAIEAQRDRMTDYEAMRIDRDRDPFVTDVVMRRYLDTARSCRTRPRPGTRRCPSRARSKAGAARCCRAPPASTRARRPATSRRSASSSARSRRWHPSAAASPWCSRRAAWSRTRASASTATW